VRFDDVLGDYNVADVILQKRQVYRTFSSCPTEKSVFW
jgi:hypothetical protein